MSAFTDFCNDLSSSIIAQMVLDFCHLDETGVMHPDAIARIKIDECAKHSNLAYHDAMVSLRQYVLAYGAKIWASTICAREKIKDLLPNGCHAVFYPQVWQNDYAVPAGDPVKFDITKQILAMSLEEIVNLEDDSDDSDQLADLDVFDHSGPFRVECKYAIQQFFGVDELEDITYDLLIQKLDEFSDLLSLNATKGAV